MIPRFNRDGNLPPGLHLASWEEFARRYGRTPRRRRLLAGLQAALKALREAGCQRVYIDGSFVTIKKVPGDFDACWDTEGVNLELLDPVFLKFENKRAAQKEKYGGEFFPARMSEGGSGSTFLEFFQIDKETGSSKGIVVLDLGNI